MKYTYCTLFDSNYSDKGVVTLQSLHKNSPNSEIFVLAMDDLCYKIISDLGFVTTIKLEDFIDDKLLEVRKKRSRAEFCWTCTASLILYVFTHYNVEICTYIDADMFFYSNPDVLVDEMIDKKKSVQIIEHRFKNDLFGMLLKKNSGTYCVEFNTFKNDEQGLRVLTDWRGRTLAHCSSDTTNGGPLGDQSYLETWPNDYNCINIVKNIGAGIAPWNVNRYKIHISEDSDVEFSFDGKGRYPCVFYHFHNIEYLTKNVVNINIFGKNWNVDEKTVYYFYYPYLERLRQEKERLFEEYSLYPLLRWHPGILKKSHQSIVYYIKRVFSKHVFISIIYRIELLYLQKKYRKKDLLYF